MTSATSSLSEIKRHERFWFDDGNVVIAAESVAFRLHRGIICLHSSVFRDMFSAPYTGESDDTIEGCPVVRVSDYGEYLTWFFALLYDGGMDPFFNPSIAAPFTRVRAMLILAYKYDVEHVRAEALRRLHKAFPATLAAHDADWADLHAEPTATQPINFNNSLDYISVVSLARSLDLPELLPYAFGQLIMDTEPEELLARREYDSGQYDELSPEDLRRCMRLIKRFAEMTFVKLMLFIDNQATDGCRGGVWGGCDKYLRSIMADVTLSGGFSVECILAPPDHVIGLSLDEMCKPCREEWVLEYDSVRAQAWGILLEIIEKP